MSGPTKNLKRPGRARVMHGAFIVAGIVWGLLVACAGQSLSPTPPPLADELTLYNWVDYMPPAVLEAFTAEYGVKVNVVNYESQEEAAANIRAGNVYDVVVLAPELIPALIADQQLAEIDYRCVLNFKYVAPSFRDLAFDPGNRYSIPFHWGTTGLLVRTDLVETPVTRWADLWAPHWAGRVALWPIQRALLPIALKSLGYAANSENPDELEAALHALEQLMTRAMFIGNDNASVIPLLKDGRAVVAYGWAYDALLAQQAGLPIAYILPEEGSILWSDSFVIPANSPHGDTAEVFLNFILRPEIGAQIVEESFYAIANEGATAFLPPDILTNPIIYPPSPVLQNAELIVPLTPAGQALYDSIWARLLTVPP